MKKSIFGKCTFVFVILFIFFICSCRNDSQVSTESNVITTQSENITGSDQEEKQVSEDIQDTTGEQMKPEESETDMISTEDGDIEEDLPYYIGLRFVLAYEPEYTKGVALSDSRVYPAPSTDVYETFVCYQGRTFDIQKKIQASDGQGTKNWWYLITYDSGNTDEYEYIGFIQAENVADAEKTSVTMGEPYQVLASKYYKKEIENDYYIGPLFFKEKSKRTGENIYISQEASDGYYYIDDLSILEPFTGVGSGRLRAGG